MISYQVVEWIQAVITAHKLNGYRAAEDLLRELEREHKFDILGMELNADLPGLDADEVRMVVHEIRFGARAKAKRQNFGMLYGRTNIQQIPRK